MDTMWKNRLTRTFALVLVCALLATGLSGCGGAPAQTPPRESRPAQSSSSGSRSAASEPRSESREDTSPEEESSESAAPAQSSGADSSSGSSSDSTYYSTVRERIKRLKEQQEQERSASSSGGSSKAPASSSSGGSSKAPVSSSSGGSSKAPASSSSGGSSKAEEKLEVLSSVDGIARLAGVKADVETYNRYCVVDVDEGENPYDVTWDYGKLYNAYVEKVDWDLLFDADYYISTFPGLAHLYHKDKALLLQHFQTVGIHEGRQGCKDFNVAAYRKNCAAKVREAFGDNYECYYLYYAMNYRTQKTVTATGSGEKKQLAVKLTNMQQTELDNVNKYRKEVGVAPLEYDPELSALACYRAYVDALEDWDAHDWIHAPENQDEIDEMMDIVKASLWSENTVHGYPSNKAYTFRQGPATPWYINYRYSQAHYEAMINAKYHYVGSANCYISDYEKENPDHPEAVAVYVQFDVFVPNLTTAFHS